MGGKVSRPVVMVHGGAGWMERVLAGGGGPYRDGLARAARAGWEALAGGSALDAVVAAVADMEDSGVFNAGLGAGLTSTGEIEMDAAVMRGEDRMIGAVAALRLVANPVRLARAVGEGTRHCLLAGEGALAFAHDRGFPLREDFPTRKQREEWLRRVLTGDPEGVSGGAAGRNGAAGADPGAQAGPGASDTVGAIACDRRSRVAAAVSTGGIWLKLPGRVGDSPLPGSGYWADDGAGAAVATGTGETILRTLLCRVVVDAMRAGASPTEACRAGLGELEGRFGPGTAGVIACDSAGRTGWAFNTAGMGRAVMRGGEEEPVVGVVEGEG